VHGVRDRAGAGGVRADVVALDGVPGRPRVLHVHAVGARRDDVPRTVRGAADGVLRRRAEDRERVRAVLERARAGGVRADQVARHDVPGRAAARDADAEALVAGDDVPRAGAAAPDRVLRRLPVDADAGRAPVRERGGAGGVRADVVALHEVPRRAGARDPDTAARVPRAQVARAGARAADGVRRRAAEDRDARRRVRDDGVPGRVRPDVVPLDEVPGRPGARDPDTAARVPRDDVPRARARAADRVLRGLVEDGDAGRAVRERGRAGGGRADPVALDDVEARPRVADPDAEAVVARDQVARARRAPADRVARRAVEEEHARARVPEVARPGRVRADVVGLDEVAARARIGDPDAVAVPRDDVPRRRARAADGVVRRAAEDRDAGEAVSVAERGRAGGVRADVVAADEVRLRAGAGDADAAARVAGDDVASSRGRAADGVAGRAGEDLDAVAAVEDRRRARLVDSDVVALDEVAARAGVLEADARARVPGDHVARGRRGAPDRVLRRSLEDDD